MAACARGEDFDSAVGEFDELVGAVGEVEVFVFGPFALGGEETGDVPGVIGFGEIGAVDHTRMIPPRNKTKGSGIIVYPILRCQSKTLQPATAALVCRSITHRFGQFALSDICSLLEDLRRKNLCLVGEGFNEIDLELHHVNR